MRQLRKNEKILGTAILGLLFLFLLNKIIVTPLCEKFNTIGQDIAGYKITIRKYAELEKQRSALLEEYKKIERYLSLKGSDDQKLTAILSKIESEAQTAGLTIVDMKPDTASGSKSTSSICKIQFTAEGNIKKIVEFLYRLETADILLKVDKFNLSIKDENAGILKMETKILGIAI